MLNEVRRAGERSEARLTNMNIVHIIRDTHQRNGATTTMATLFDILDGIISSDNADEILTDRDMVESYADACGETISSAQAGRIIEVGQNWRHEMDNGNGEWSRMRHEAKAALDD